MNLKMKIKLQALALEATRGNITEAEFKQKFIEITGQDPDSEEVDRELLGKCADLLAPMMEGIQWKQEEAERPAADQTEREPENVVDLPEDEQPEPPAPKAKSPAQTKAKAAQQ